MKFHPIRSNLAQRLAVNMALATLAAYLGYSLAGIVQGLLAARVFPHHE